MGNKIRRLVVSLIIAFAAAPLASPAHGPSEDHKATVAEHDEVAMKAQHERMDRFKEAMERIAEAIILSDGKGAAEGAEKLALSIKGHEKDMPHKNRARAKEFHSLFIALEKRTTALRAAILGNDISKAGAAYGKVLETCVSCHRKFRD